MNEQQIDALLKSFDAAQQLMTMLDQWVLGNGGIIVGQLGKEWIVTAPRYLERFASPVEAYRHALTIARDGIPEQAGDNDTP